MKLGVLEVFAIGAFLVIAAGWYWWDAVQFVGSAIWNNPLVFIVAAFAGAVGSLAAARS